MFTIRGIDGKDYGPVTPDQVRQWIQQRRANSQTQVQAEGSPDWKPLAEFPEFASDLAAAAPSAPSPDSQSSAPAAPSATPHGTAQYSAVPETRTNPLCITSLVFGILSIVCCGMLGLVFAILALVFGGIGLSQVGKAPETFTGRGLAIAGLVLGGLGLIVGIAATVFLFNGGLEQIMEKLNQQQSQP